jgi:hypothetical protein
MMRARLAAILGVLILAPIGAEYLVGYDSSTGNWRELLGNLLLFAPLYGAPALLIRELSVRTQTGWRGRICWAGAFGIVEAALIDHSLFNPSYRDISYWQDMVGPTWIPVLGFGLASALSFVVGHLVFSICAPLALVEAVHPTVRHRTWLGPVGLVIAAVCYLAASAFALQWTLRTEDFVPSLGQFIGAGAAVVALIVAGLVLGRRPHSPVSGRTPSPWLLGIGAMIATVAFEFDQSWVGLLVAVTVLVGAFAALSRFSRTRGWSNRHLLLVVGGVMLARALEGFLVDPIGDGSDLAKYLHNTAAVLLVIVLVAIGWFRGRAARPSTGSGHITESPADGPARTRHWG